MTSRSTGWRRLHVEVVALRGPATPTGKRHWAEALVLDSDVGS